jgi:hypothetical protein
MVNTNEGNHDPFNGSIKGSHTKMVSSKWPPKNHNTSEGHHDSFNDSFKGSRSWYEARTQLTPPSKTSNGVEVKDWAKSPRLELFDSKADIQYLPDEDDLAASVYGQQSPSRKQVDKEPTTGTDKKH